MTRTVVLHDVPASELDEVLKDLKSDGYNTSHDIELDGEYTVTGSKEE